MQNLLSIGYEAVAPGTEAYQLLAMQVRQQGQSYTAEHGSYYCLADTTGTQLWALYDTYDQLRGLYPMYAGRTSRTVGLESRTQGRNPLVGSYKAWAEPEDQQDVTSGLYAFAFDTAAYGLLHHVPLGQQHSLNLAAFAQGIRFYPSADAFMESQGDASFKIPIPAFFPAGLFVTGGAGAAIQQGTRAMVAFTGTVRQAVLRENSVTQKGYVHLVADTLGGPVDIVADTALVPLPPEPGDVFTGNFWLCGHFPGLPYQAWQPPRKNLWQRLGLWS